MQAHGAAGGPGAATILIVEDSPVQAELLRRALAAAGYRVIVAGDGEQGLAMARANNPAAVVSDINMPLMDGYELCHRLRQDGVLGKTPVILLTTLTDARDVVRGLNAGANCYVTKPYDERFLLSRIGGLLSEPPTLCDAPIEIEAKINGARFPVRAGAEQILDLLVCTYENAMLQNRELAAARDALAASGIRLEEKVRERTHELERANAELARKFDERARLEEQLQQANAKLNASVEGLRQRNAQLALLDSMGNRLQACRSLDQACQVVAESAAQLLPASPGLLALADAGGQRFSVAANWGDIRFGARTWSADACQALRGCGPHVATGIDTVIACTRDCAALDTVGICMPLVSQGETLGVLHLQGAIAALAVAEHAAHREQESKLRLVDAAATTIALAIANLRLQEDLRQQSLHDPLTGLYNRRFLQDALDREAARARRSGAPLGVLMLDIDHFKQINDSHGHLAGDMVLRWLGRFLRDGVRGEDMACRYGGEEFILLVPGANLENAALRAEQIRVGVAGGSVIEFDGVTIGPVTVSLGVAALCMDRASHACITDAVSAADAALRRAKQQGRNRIVLADSENMNRA